MRSTETDGYIPMPDNDGYPTNEELDAIRSFDGAPPAWFDLINAAWWAADWGWHEEPGSTPTQATIYISTGGWSGNEEIIVAMQKNAAWLWTMTWLSSRRGGHYTFQLCFSGVASP
jgi:hypothetical protein